jgi:hypothetical protein
MEDMGEEERKKKESNCQTKKLKSGHGPHWGPGTKMNWPTDRRTQYNLKLKFRNCKLQTRPLIREGALHEKIKKIIVTQRNVTSGHKFQSELNTKTY